MKINLKSLSLLLSALLAVSVSYSCRKSSDAEPAAEASADITPLTVTGCIGRADTKVTYTIGSSKISQKWAVGDTIIGIDDASTPKTYTYVVTKVSKDTASFSLVKGGSGSRFGTATDNPSYGTKMYMIYAPGYAASNFTSSGSLAIDISKQDTTIVGDSASGLHIPAIMTADGEVSGDNKLELTFTNQLELLMIKNPTLSGRSTATTISSFTVSGTGTLPTKATFSKSGFAVDNTSGGTVTKNCSLKTTDTGTTSGTVLIALLPASTQNLIIKSSNSYFDTLKSHTPTASKLLKVSGAKFAPVMSGVTITPASATTDVGSTVSLTYTVQPEGAAVTSKAWSSSDEDVATVTDGVVTGVAAGFATITIKVNNTYTATCTVTVNPPAVTGVTITPSSATIDINSTVNLTYTVEPTGAEVTSPVWTSSNETVATVTDGVVTGNSAGSATITLTVTDKYDSSITRTATCTVTVQKPVLLSGKFTVASGKQVQFTRGNLYWDGSAFHIEANQTDYPTAWSTSHVGHFFWTNLTDYTSGNTAYMPYASSYSYSSQSKSDTFWCGEDNKLTVDGQGGLYALSCDEWTYLIKTRTNASSLYKYGVTVSNGGMSYTNCLIIAPDSFSGTLASSYTLDEVNASGLVCLPAAGNRYGSSVSEAGSVGYYWSSTPLDDASYAHRLKFYSSNVYPASNEDRSSSYSVRLVK